MSNNYEAIFDHNQQIISIQIKDLDEIWKDIIQKYAIKSGIDIETVYFVYSGNTINQEYSVNQIINSDDKISKKIRILVNDIQKTINNSKIVNSKNIICPICQEDIKIKIKDYKIFLYDCKNGHKINDILLDEFENKQKIDESKIVCGICKNNKSKVYDNLFYKCYQCEINLCPICKSTHDKVHNIRIYEQGNYICAIHNEAYISYCKSCKKNICMECEEIHNNHKITYFGKIKPNTKDIENKKKELYEKLYKMKEDIRNIINILNKVFSNMNIYMNIYLHIMDSIEEKKRNYEILSNLNEIMNNNEIIEDLNKIINNKDIYNKFINILYIYNKMNKKEIIKSTTTINKNKKLENSDTPKKKEINKNLNTKNSLNTLDNSNQNNLNISNCQINVDNNMNNINMMNNINIHNQNKNHINNSNNLNMNYMNNQINNFNMHNFNDIGMNNVIMNNMGMNNMNNMGINNMNNMGMNNMNNMGLNNMNNMGMNNMNNMGMNNMNNMGMNNMNNIGMNNMNNMGMNNMAMNNMGMNNMAMNNMNNMNNKNFQMMSNNGIMDNETTNFNKQSIFLTFTFEEYNEQIFIDVNENEKFQNLINEIEGRYNWLKSIKDKNYFYQNKQIVNFDLSIKELNIVDNSNINILVFKKNENKKIIRKKYIN